MQNRKKFIKIIFSVCLFALFLGYFVSGSGWYAPAKLIIKGFAPDGTDTLKVTWNSGNGWNRYESEIFPMEHMRRKGQSKHIVTIKTLPENSASAGAEIVCTGVETDGHLLDLEGIALKPGVYRKGQRIKLNKVGDSLSFKIASLHHLRFQFKTNNRSGKIEIDVDGRKRIEDLYIANIEAKFGTFDYWFVDNDHGFAVTMDLPRYRIKDLRVSNRNSKHPIFLTSVFVNSQVGERFLDIDSRHPLKTVSFSHINRWLKRHFQPLQFLFQIFFALISTWLISALWRYSCSLGGIRSVFTGKRKVFWAFLIGAFTMYCLWWFIFWPGVMSVDSLKVWRAAQFPNVFLNDHPFLNVILYKYLTNIWNNPAVVPLAQIILTSVLLSVIFYTLYQQGVPLFVIIPCYLWLIFSIPVGLYNIVLWKDIPFALLVVFWAFLLADFYRKKREGIFAITREQIFALLLLLLALGLIRYNGLLYFIGIPIVATLLGLVNLRRLLKWGGGGILLVFFLLIVFHHELLFGPKSFFFLHAKEYFGALKLHSFQDNLARTWHQYWGILNVNQTESRWDLWHYFLHDRSAYGFLKHAGWNDIYNYLAPEPTPLSFLRGKAMSVYWKSYSFPWVYLTWNPVWILPLFLLTILLFRWLSISAIFSSIVILQVFGLLLITGVLNYRYYYFIVLAAYFLLPMIWLDVIRLMKRKESPSRN